MQVSLLNNSCFPEKTFSRLLAAKKTESIPAAETCAIKAAVQAVMEKTTPTEISPVRMSNNSTSHFSDLSGTINSLISERVQQTAALIDQGIDPTKAKYAVAGEMVHKAKVALEQYINENEEKALKEGIKETPTDETAETQEEYVEEVIVTDGDPSSDEGTRIVKVTRKVSVESRGETSSDSNIKTAVTRTPKGQTVDINV